MSEDLTNFRFYLTEEMNKMFIDIIISKQILENGNLTSEEEIALKKHIELLTDDFVEQFRKRNIERLKKYDELINQ